MKTIKLVNFFAGKLASRCPAGFSFDDAQQEMLIVLMEARRLHTAEHTQTFVTFLENRLRWRYRTLVRLHVYTSKMKVPARPEVINPIQLSPRPGTINSSASKKSLPKPVPVSGAALLHLPAKY